MKVRTVATGKPIVRRRRRSVRWVGVALAESDAKWVEEALGFAAATGRVGDNPNADCGVLPDRHFGFVVVSDDVFFFGMLFLLFLKMRIHVNEHNTANPVATSSSKTVCEMRLHDSVKSSRQLVLPRHVPACH